jgi:hypothetical protein
VTEGALQHTPVSGALRLTKDDYGWATDAELDVAQLPVLTKNLTKNFMNTFFIERGSRSCGSSEVNSHQLHQSGFGRRCMSSGFPL